MSLDRIEGFLEEQTKSQLSEGLGKPPRGQGMCLGLPKQGQLGQVAKLRHQLLEIMKSEYPFGHPEFLPMLLEMAKLHSEKNHDYASGGNALGNFDRASKLLSQYPGLKLSDRRVVALVYMLKQLDALLWGISNSIEHRVEGNDSRLADIAVYATIIRCMEREDAAANQGNTKTPEPVVPFPTQLSPRNRVPEEYSTQCDYRLGTSLAPGTYNQQGLRLED